MERRGIVRGVGARRFDVDLRKRGRGGRRIGELRANRRGREGRKKVVAFSGVSDLLVVDAGDALLVAKKGDEEGMKRLVARLKELGLYDLF
ncbi:MAG: hypothetical protein ACI4SW_06215 [Thermoguttaceae bacterium]